LLVVAGFFLPWVEGAAVLDTRAFSGFDLARLLRNFEIAVASGTSVNQIRLSAIALYLVPALAVNAAVLQCLSLRVAGARPAARVAALAAGFYAAAALTVLFFLSQVRVNDFERVVGTPAWGSLLVVAGAGLFVWLGVFARPGNDSAAA
jgi:hypothetical protein